jgi:hypothetical protein
VGDPSRWACQSETTLHWSCGAGKFSSNRMLPLVPQVVAFVGPRGRLAAHLGTVYAAYALWVVADAKATGRVGSVAPRKWPIATEIPCTMNAAIATPVSTTRHR